VVLFYVQMISIREYNLAGAACWNQRIFYSSFCWVLEYYHTDNCGVMYSLLESETYYRYFAGYGIITLKCYVQFIGIRTMGTYGIKAFKYYQIEIQLCWNQNIYYSCSCGHENVQYLNTEMLCSCITFVHT